MHSWTLAHAFTVAYTEEPSLWWLCSWHPYSLNTVLCMQLTLQNIVFLYYPKYLKNKFANNWLFSVQIELLRRKLLTFLFFKHVRLKYRTWFVSRWTGDRHPSCLSNFLMDSGIKSACAVSTHSLSRPLIVIRRLIFTLTFPLNMCITYDVTLIVVKFKSKSLSILLNLYRGWGLAVKPPTPFSRSKKEFLHKQNRLY